MRVGVILWLLGVGATVALPASALAGPRADYKQMFTTPVPGTSTGTDTQILYKNPSDPSAKPIPVRREVFTFPAGTTYDGSVVPDCTASDAEIVLLGKSACPPESWMGKGLGDTTMSGFPGAGESALDVDGWDAPGNLALFGRDHASGIGFVTRVRREGQVVTVDVPRSPGGPPDGESALRRVHNVFAARSLGDRAYMRTPSTCPSSGVWTFKAHLIFADGAVEDDTYEMPCRRERDVTAPDIRVAGMPRGHCVAHDFRMRVTVADASPLRRVRLLLDDRVLRVTKAASFEEKVRVRDLPAGRHRLWVVARDTAGNVASRPVKFARCTPSVTRR